MVDAAHSNLSIEILYIALRTELSDKWGVGFFPRCSVSSPLLTPHIYLIKMQILTAEG